jgi:hypothetical protein
MLVQYCGRLATEREYGDEELAAAFEESWCKAGPRRFWICLGPILYLQYHRGPRFRSTQNTWPETAWVLWSCIRS